MAKDKGFKKSIRNRGEDIGYPDSPPTRKGPERAIKRKEVQNIYEEMHHQAIDRNDRAMARVASAQNEFYAGLDPRRRQEIADGGIVREDNNATANLPRMAQHHEYPKAGYYSSQYLDDILKDIDNY